MEAIRLHEYGNPDVLRYEHVEEPVPGPDDVRIRVAGAAFNPVDAGIRGGYLQAPFPVTLPHVPRIDVAGTVDVTGADVTNRRAGDRVIGFLPMVAAGAAAEYVIAPAQILANAPVSIPLADAAALPSVGLTAWQSLFEHADLRAGQRLLVNGAGRSGRRLCDPARAPSRRVRNCYGQPAEHRAGPQGRSRRDHRPHHNHRRRRDHAAARRRSEPRDDCSRGTHHAGGSRP